jgi:hypothetical protein
MKSARRNKNRSPLSLDLALRAVRILAAGSVGGGLKEHRSLPSPAGNRVTEPEHQNHLDPQLCNHITQQ